MANTDCNPTQINLRRLLCVPHGNCLNPLSSVGREVGKTEDTLWSDLQRTTTATHSLGLQTLAVSFVLVKMTDHNSYHVPGKDLGQDLASYDKSRMSSDRAIIGFPSESTSSSIIPFPSAETTLAPFHGTHYDSSPTQNSRKRKLDEPIDFFSRKEHRSLYETPFESDTNLAYSAEYASQSQSSVALAPIQQSHHHHQMPSQSLENVPRSREFPGPYPITRDWPEKYDEFEDSTFMHKPGMPLRLPGPAGSKSKFNEVEDATLIELKEIHDLTWKQIQRWFPGRTSGTLQVRYCTKLKRKPIEWTAEKVCLSLSLYSAIQMDS